MKTFKTKGGTELPLLDLKGKDYLQVAHRVVWFREEHPRGQIQSNIIKFDDAYCLFKATIFNDDNIELASAHGREDAKHFADYIEKAETKAIGRALALCGYGTAHAPEFDEKERLADAPLPKLSSTKTPNGQKTDGAEKFSRPILDEGIHSMVKSKKIPTEKVKAMIGFRFTPKTQLAELSDIEARALFAELAAS